MPITIKCQCGRLLKIPDKLAGRRVRCPKCDAAVDVPKSAAQSKPSTESEPAKSRTQEAKEDGAAKTTPPNKPDAINPAPADAVKQAALKQAALRKKSLKKAALQQESLKRENQAMAREQKGSSGKSPEPQSPQTGGSKTSKTSDRPTSGQPASQQAAHSPVKPESQEPPTSESAGKSPQTNDGGEEKKSRFKGAPPIANAKETRSATRGDADSKQDGKRTESGPTPVSPSAAKPGSQQKPGNRPTAPQSGKIRKDSPHAAVPPPLKKTPVTSGPKPPPLPNQRPSVDSKTSDIPAADPPKTTQDKSSRWRVNNETPASGHAGSASPVRPPQENEPTAAKKTSPDKPATKKTSAEKVQPPKSQDVASEKPTPRSAGVKATDKRHHKTSTAANPGPSQPAASQSSEKQSPKRESSEQQTAPKQTPQKQTPQKQESARGTPDQQPAQKRTSETKPSQMGTPPASSNEPALRKSPPKPPPRKSTNPAEPTAAAAAPRETKEPEPQAEVHGVVATLQQRITVFYLAGSLVAIALFGMSPAIWNVFEVLLNESAGGIARWALVLLVVGVIQLAYAAYATQLPDWTTVWVLALMVLCMATGYAVFLGICMMSTEQNEIMVFLDLGDRVYGSKATGWCFIMVAISSLFTYFAGGISVKWYRTERQLREAVGGH